MYTTLDFYVAAYIMSSGIPLADNWREGHKTVFAFCENDTLDELVEEFYSLQASVEPMQYGNAIRNLKTIIHTQKSKTDSHTNQRNNHDTTTTMSNR